MIKDVRKRSNRLTFSPHKDRYTSTHTLSISSVLMRVCWGYHGDGMRVHAVNRWCRDQTLTSSLNAIFPLCYLPRIPVSDPPAEPADKSINLTATSNSINSVSGSGLRLSLSDRDSIPHKLYLMFYFFFII